MKTDTNLKRKILCAVIIIIFILSLMPLIEISQYCRPAADDFNYARTTFKAWRDTHALTAVFKGAVETAVRFWNTWQGTYASAFLMSLQPGIFGGKWYGLTGIFMMAVIIGSTVTFSVYFVKRLFKCSFLEGLTIGAVMSTLMIQFMPSTIQGLYWFNGSVHYGFFFAVLLIYICNLIELQRASSNVKETILFLMCCLLAFVLEGGNQITGLMGIVFTAVMLICRCKSDKRKTIENIIIICLMLFCLYLNLGSPGTAIRLEGISASAEANSIEKLGVIKTIYTAGCEGIKSVGNWFGFKDLCLLVITSPILFNIAKRIKEQSGFKFQYPLLVIVLSVAWISIMYCPTLYAQGNTGGSRLTNIIYYTYVVLLFLNAVYITGWMQELVSAESIERIRGFHWKYIVTSVILLIAMVITFGKSSWGYKAKIEIMSGDPQIYAEEFAVREEILMNSKGQDAEIPEYTAEPQLIYLDDISRNSSDWRNTGMARYYECESVDRYEVD